MPSSADSPAAIALSTPATGITPRPPQAHSVVYLRMPNELKNRLVDRARKEQKTINELACKLLGDNLDILDECDRDNGIVCVESN